MPNLSEDPFSFDSLADIDSETRKVLQEARSRGECPQCHETVVEGFGTGMLEDGIFCRIECFVAFRIELVKKHGLKPPPDRN